MKMKLNKFKVFQILLIFIIFTLVGIYLASADSIYTVKTSGDDAIINNNEDIIDLKSALKNKSLVNIHYDIYKDNLKLTTGSYGCDIEDKDGNIITLPYIYIEQSGFNLNEFDLYIDGLKLKEIINQNGSFLKEFYLDFYTYYVDSTGEETTKLNLNCKRKIILNYDEITEENMKLGNFNLKPINVVKNSIGLTNLSNFKLDSYSASNNTYNYSLNIKVGEKESLKQYAYEISLLSDVFPYSNIMNISNATIEPTKESENIKVDYSNKIKDYNNNLIDIDSSINKKLIISAIRTDNKQVTETNSYKIILNTFNPDIKITLNLTINLNMDNYNETLSGNRYVFEDDTKKVINKFTGNSDLILNLNYNKASTSFKILNSNEEDITNSNLINFKDSSLSEYLTFSGEIYSKSFTFKKDIPEGFYTIESYEPTNKVYTNGDNIDEEATLNTQIKTSSYTFYLSNEFNFDIKLFDDGKNIPIDNKEVSINIPTDNNNSLNSIAIDCALKDEANFINDSYNYKFVNNLTDMQTLSKVTLSNDKIMKISGTISLDKFYMIVTAKESNISEIITINIIHKGLKDLVVSLNMYPKNFKIPSTKTIESAELKPVIKVDGVNVDNISNFNYDYILYKLKDSNYEKFETNDIYIEKGVDKNIGTDTLFVNDFAPSGSFMIECYIKDKDAVKATEYFTINYDDTVSNEYSIKFLNNETKLTIPKSGYINTLKISTKILKNGIETTLKPTKYTVTGDNYVSTKDSSIIITDKATVGKIITIKADLNDVEGNILATNSMSFELVDSNGSGETEPSTGEETTKDPTDVTNNVPKDIVLTGFSTEGNLNYLDFTKVVGEQKTLTYKCYDKDNKIIENPSISIKFEGSNGYNIKGVYKDKQIIITSNGLYENKTISIIFYNNDNVLKTYTLQLNKPKAYDCSLKIVQTKIVRNGKILAQATFKNNSLVQRNILLALVCYDKNNSMVSYELKPTTLKSGSEINDEKPLEVKLTVPEDTRDLTIKAFLLDGSTLENSVDFYTSPVIITNKED